MPGRHLLLEGRWPVLDAECLAAGTRLVFPHLANDSEASVPGGAIRRVATTCGDAVAEAVRIVAKVRASADDTVGAFSGSVRIVFRGACVVAGTEPVAAPLPDVACHVVEAEAVGFEG